MDDLTKIIENFKDKSIVDTALTHRSWLNEHGSEGQSNERLEFLGDAILEFLVSEHIYNKFPDQEEGYLTALRANLVNTVNLSKVANRLGMGKLLKMSKGEEESGGKDNPSLLANTMEAIIGAIFIDRGLESVKEFLDVNILVDVDEIVSKPLKDAKSRLQEKIQAKGLFAPKYNVIKEEGPDHSKSFTVQVAIDGSVAGEGSGKSKSEAEQVAATNVLENIDSILH